MKKRKKNQRSFPNMCRAYLERQIWCLVLGVLSWRHLLDSHGDISSWFGVIGAWTLFDVPKLGVFTEAVND